MCISIVGFPGSSAGKVSSCNAGDPSSIPGSGRPTGEGIGYPLQYSCASLVAQLVKNPPAMWRPGFDPWVGKIPWRREWLPTLVFWPGIPWTSPWGCKKLEMTERLSLFLFILSVQFSSVAQSCPTNCDPMNRSTPGLPVYHQLPEFTQTHVHQVSDAIQPSHPLSPPSPPAPNPSQHQSLFQ